MAEITVDDVLKLARLSKIQLTTEELNEFSKELQQIIKYVEQLSSVDIDGLEPTSQVTGLTNVTREDELIDYGVSVDDLLKNVPNLENNQIKVKRVIE
ncbi:MAG: Asp-tRNA(Asn)/Glu-tRNA(Gln) amidotransferase subunit GatC [Candidatus Nomurabacteria bacterium]|nr:MAG: Asp-tRNA(Asn)/Glu-tRNA(Gln) amidotransferase subunit GatC [Candidatus Nomurabacteria bacterium]